VAAPRTSQGCMGTSLCTERIRNVVRRGDDCGRKRRCAIYWRQPRTMDHDGRSVVPAFAQWSQARRKFLRRSVTGKTSWSPELANKVYSTQLWQLVKAWEMMQEYGLEERGRDLFGSTADARAWCIPAETAPSAAHIPDGASGVGGSALTNEYFTAGDRDYGLGTRRTLSTF